MCVTYSIKLMSDNRLCMIVEDLYIVVELCRMQNRTAVLDCLSVLFQNKLRLC